MRQEMKCIKPVRESGMQDTLDPHWFLRPQPFFGKSLFHSQAARGGRNGRGHTGERTSGCPEVGRDDILSGTGALRPLKSTVTSVVSRI